MVAGDDVTMLMLAKLVDGGRPEPVDPAPACPGG
jgi:hypothetical protein